MPAEAQSTPAALVPVAEVDVSSFTARADAWHQARAERRQADLDRADEIALQAKEAEATRLAEEEATRLAEEEARREAEEAEAARLAEQEAARRAEELARATTTTTTAAPTTTTAAPTTAAPAPAPPAGGPSAAQWAALRQCESSGNYAAVSPNGRYRGAYQFSQDTWDWVAGTWAGHLVGVDPAAASPADQDGQARQLYQLRGAAPWPHCGAHLR